jgi:hypothetical protein
MPKHYANRSISVPLYSFRVVFTCINQNSIFTIVTTYINECNIKLTLLNVMNGDCMFRPKLTIIKLIPEEINLN